MIDEIRSFSRSDAQPARMRACKLPATTGGQYGFQRILVEAYCKNSGEILENMAKQKLGVRGPISTLN